MIKAGDERGTNPLTWQDGELMRTRGDDDRMIVVHHQGEGGGQLVLWVLFQGAALAWHAVVVQTLKAMPDHERLVWRADVLLEREAAIKASAWGMEHRGRYRLTYSLGEAVGQGLWRGEHLDEESGRHVLSTWAFTTAAEALAALERTADLVEVTQIIEREVEQRG